MHLQADVVLALEGFMPTEMQCIVASFRVRVGAPVFVVHHHHRGGKSGVGKPPQEGLADPPVCCMHTCYVAEAEISHGKVVDWSQDKPIPPDQPK